MSELVTTRIRDHGTRLALPHLAEHLEALLARAEAGTMGYLEFVDLALGEEVGVREGRRFRAALKLSGLAHHKGLDEFGLKRPGFRAPLSLCERPGWPRWS